MIVPMKKYSFLVYHADYSGFLENLRKLGAVDVVERTKDLDDETRDQLLEQKQLADTIKLLQRRKQEPIEKDSGFVDGTEVAHKVRELILEQETLEQQFASVNKEIAALEPWGDFSMETLKKLREAGLYILFMLPLPKNSTLNGRKNTTSVW